MSGIDRVLQRISNIEQRFQPKPARPAAAFNQVLNAELNGALQSPARATAVKPSAAGLSEIKNMIELSSGQYGVDPKLIAAVAQNESNFNPNAVSEAGAVGVMQLMPGTAQALGVQNIYDPRQNIDGGVKYLKELLTSFNGDVTKAVAAYNAGPQAVIDFQGVPPYRETQAYVGKVLQQYRDAQ